LSLGEDLPKHSGLPAQFTQQLNIQHFELSPLLTGERLPAVLLRNRHIATVGRLAVLIRHFQENQVAKWLQVVPLAHAIVSESCTEAP
jgi:hypothetical protein